MTRPELLAYVESLSPDARDLFRLADAMARDVEDTLSEEFQIAAAVLDVFRARAGGPENFPP